MKRARSAVVACPSTLPSSFHTAPTVKKNKRARLARAASAKPSLTSAPPFQLLSLLPPPLLAMAASHLPHDALLRVQRCSFSMQQLRDDESYMAVAWSSAGVTLNCSVRLADWTLRAERCVKGRRDSIPVDVWRAALPAIREVVGERESCSKHAGPPVLRQLREWAHKPQPTTWLQVRHDEDGRLSEVLDAEAQLCSGVERVEVLRDISVGDMLGVVPAYVGGQLHCRLVLQACPALQHLTLCIERTREWDSPHHPTLELVPRLRSVSVIQLDPRQPAAPPSSQLWRESYIDFNAGMLDQLPRLTALRLTDIHVDVSLLTRIVAKATLEELHIEATGERVRDSEWLGNEVRFPVDAVQEDEQQVQRAAAGVVFDAVNEAEQDEEKAPAAMDYELRHMLRWLNSEQPTRRSCETRLALADWLHRRLKRGWQHTDHRFTCWLCNFRQHLALLRSTVRRQLSELRVAAAGEADEDTGESKRLDMQQRFAGRRHAVQHLALLHDTRKRMDWWHEQLSAEERGGLADKRARLERQSEAQQRRVTELDVTEPMQRLTEQVAGPQREAAVEQDQASAAN